MILLSGQPLLPPLPGMVARESSEGSFSEDVDGLPVAAVTHRRGEVQRDPHPAPGEVPGRRNQVPKGRSGRRPGTDLEAGGFESLHNLFLKRKFLI